MRYSSILKHLPVMILLSALLVAALPDYSARAATSIIYVRAGSNGGGTSWTDAYGHLQDALTAANPATGDTVQIRVAAGVYYPDRGGSQTDDDRSATFQLKNSVELYGGFPPTGNPDFAERDPTRYQTVLSGDIDDNDDQQPVITDLDSETNNLSNSYHVITADGVDAGAVLDGFSITAGNANGTFASSCGPACGSGVYNNNNSTATFANVTISGNTAASRGGGVYSDDSAATFANVTISGNTADLYGGGIYTVSDATIFTNVTINGNTATYGGGVYNVGGTASFTNVRILGNEAEEGGGVFHGGSDASFTNMLLTGNRANGATSGTVGGGGMVNNSNSNPELINVTIAGNYSNDNGGGMLNNNDSDPFITNSIIWGNASGSSGQQVFNATADDTITYDYSLVEGTSLSGTNFDGTDPLNDPQFVDPVAPAGINTPNTDGDYHLRQGSNLIDASIEFSVLGNVDTDLDNTPRFVSTPGTVDLGPYELQCPTTTPARAYVDAAAAGVNTGLDWTNAMPDLQSALALTDRCSTPRITEIWVAQGIYSPDQGGTMVPNDRQAAFRLRNNLLVYGGFAGNETQRSQRDPAANPTILSGDIDGNDSQQPVVTAPDSATGTRSNSYHVVIADNVTSKTILDGFTITAGFAEDDTNPDERGAGMLVINDAAPQLENLTLQGNVAEFGGGIHSNASRPILTNVTIINNIAGSTGGGIDHIDSTPELTNVSISGNTAKAGGGIFNRNSDPDLINLLVTGNRARDIGGGIYAADSNMTLINGTIAGNRAENAGGGVYNFTDSDTTMVNVLIAGNAATDDEQVYNSATLSLADSLITDGCPTSATCTNVLETDPAFVAPRPATDAPTDQGNYRLQATSPAIDQGDTNVVPAAVTTDLVGNMRIVDGDGDTSDEVDMGSYEFLPLAPTGITLSARRVAEDAAAGTTVGTLTCTDANPGESLSLSLSDDASGRFTLAGDVLQVADGAQFDYQRAASHNITVRCSDAGGLSVSETFSIAVTEVLNTIYLPLLLK